MVTIRHGEGHSHLTFALGSRHSSHGIAVSRCVARQLAEVKLWRHQGHRAGNTIMTEQRNLTSTSRAADPACTARSMPSKDQQANAMRPGRSQCHTLKHRCVFFPGSQLDLCLFNYCDAFAHCRPWIVHNSYSFDFLKFKL